MAAKFSDQGPIKQLLILLAFFGVSGSTIGGAILAFADDKLDKKYATDEDVQAVQVRVEQEVTRITSVVQSNTTTVQATAKSVDSLSLVVLGLQIEKLESSIVDLEARKRTEGANWNQREENQLRSAQRALHDLEAQRQILFNRIVTASQ